MKKIILFLLLISSLLISHAQSITSCENPEGYSYTHFAGLVPRPSSGFEKDKITGGMVTLQKIGEKKYDIQFVDIRKQIISAISDGGAVILMRKGKSDATFLHYYPGKVIEIYTFWVDSDGHFKYDLVQSKGGDSMPIHKISNMVGTCGRISFDLID